MTNISLLLRGKGLYYVQKRLYPPTTQRRKGSALIVLITVAAILTSMIALSTAKISQASLGSLGSSKIALQAQQYAAAKADFIKATDYDELAEQAIEEIPNSNFYDEVIIGNETLYPGKDDIYQRVCTINVYLYGDVLPRYSLKVTKTSVDLRPSVPPGSILPWHGNLAEIPEGFALCDGSNGTPDLRDRFIVGAGNEYNLNDTGGEKEVLLEAEQTASHYHYFGQNRIGHNNGYFLALNASGNTNYNILQGSGSINWNGSGHSASFSTGKKTGTNLITSLAVGVDATKPHENRPPYYALYYIMKLDD